MRARILLTVVLCVLGPLAAEARQQDEFDPGRFISRGTLESLLTRWEAAAASPAYSAELRARAEGEAALMRSRLQEGDFRVGDRIYLEVDQEEALTDTFTVDAGQIVTLPDVGDISVAGVLRTELQTHLAEQLTRYFRNPQVRAQALIPLTILGGVGTPGFYTMSSSILLTDALTMAGGPTGDANLTGIEVEREGEVLWTGDELEDAIVQGRTLDQLSLRPGDRIVVPTSGSTTSSVELVRTVTLVLGIPFTLVGLGNLIF